jgi:hypothetical protein
MTTLQMFSSALMLASSFARTISTSIIGCEVARTAAGKSALVPPSPKCPRDHGRDSRGDGPGFSLFQRATLAPQQN